MENPQTIQDEIAKVRMQKYFKDLNTVYDKLENIVHDELNMSLLEFFNEYFEIADNIDKGS
jgi:hypothetical protein